MKITIQKAKNGENTALVEGHFLHSNYSPVKEAERFVENLSLPYTPYAVIITEPGLSYAADFFKKSFPGIKLGAIRYVYDFSDYDDKFDFIIHYESPKAFENYLINHFTEEQLLTSIFISWPASAQIFKDFEKGLWLSVKKVLERSKTLLITRQYFEKKWLINACNLIKYSKDIITFNKTIDKDLLIISSGPSLIPFLPLIREKQSSFFIICLSSAISACLKNSIIPDLCMTTDGGYWAGEHLKKLYKHNIPLAISSEARCPKKLLSSLRLLLLNYPDGISNTIIKTSKLYCMNAVRNGTVSGTALCFGLSYFSGDIYLCGLDLAEQEGYQHSQPNELEVNNSLTDNKINTKEKRLIRSSLSRDSLAIYREWFCNNPVSLENRKVYRLIEDKDKKNSLVWIKDINLQDFEKVLTEKPDTESDSSNDIFISHKITNERSEVFKLFENKELSEKWKQQLFPLDYVQAIHDPENEEIKERIEKQWLKLKSNAEDILNDDL